MVETNNKIITSKNTNYVKTLLWISVPVFLFMISFLVFLWCSLDKNINDIKEENKKKKTGFTVSIELLSIFEEYLNDNNIDNKSRYIEKLIEQDLERKGITINKKF